MKQTSDVGSTTLLEIDWQGWVDAIAHDRSAADRAREVRSIARVRGWPVVCSRYLSPDADDPARADPNTPEAAFLAGLGPQGDDPVVTKYGRDVFDVPATTTVLTDLGTGHVLLTGLMTDHGVALAAHGARTRGLRVTVIADACAATGAGEHDRTLAGLRAAGIGVVRAEDLEAW